MIRKTSLILLSLFIVLTACKTEASIDFNQSFISETGEVHGFTKTETATNTNSLSVTNKFDLQKGVVMLNSGYEMPILGIGTYALSSSS